jgi:hypothetical protein
MDASGYSVPLIKVVRFAAVSSQSLACFFLLDERLENYD